MSQLLAMLGAMTSPATPAFSRDAARLGVADRPARTGAATGTPDATGRDVPPEFAAMLTMLAGGPSMLRTDLVPKLPADEVALVDRLIDGQLGEGQATGVAALAAAPLGAAAGAAEAPGHAGESMDYALRTLLGAMASAAAPGQPIPNDPSMSAEARQAFAETGLLAPVLPTNRPDELLVRQDGPPMGYLVVTFPGAQEVATDLRNLYQRLQGLRPETLAVLQQALAPQGTPSGAVERLVEGAAKGLPLNATLGAQQAAATTRAVGQQLMDAVRASMKPVQPTPEPNEQTDAAVSRHTLTVQARALQLAGLDTPARQGLQALLAGAAQPGRDAAALMGASAFDGVQARLAALEPAAREALAALLGTSAASPIPAPQPMPMPVAPTPVATTVTPAAAENIGTRLAHLESPARAALTTLLAATPLAPLAALVDGARAARTEGDAAASEASAPAAVESPLATMAALESQVAALSPAAREALQQLLNAPATVTTVDAPQDAPRPVRDGTAAMSLPQASTPALPAPARMDSAPMGAMEPRLLGAMDAGVRASLDALAAALEALDATVTSTTTTPAASAAPTARPVLREAPVASAAPTTAVRDLDGVAPALQAKVQRVIDRMRQEYGHDVTVVEATRSQERQDYLFAQGRTRPGPVVTWTRDSAHTHGNAVDVVVDGSWDNPAGFARLQRIAREEGLRTLGMRDPGHLELATESVGARTVTAPVASAPTATGMAQVAGVAGVAGTAATAGVAQVAAPGVGTPGIGTPTGMAADRAALRAVAARTAPRATAQGTPQGTPQGVPHAPQDTAATTADVAASVATATGATTPATPTTPQAAPQGGAPAPRADLGQGGSSRDRGSDRRDDRQLADAEALAASVTAGGSATDATPRIAPQDPSLGTVAAPRVVEAAPPAPSRVSELAPGAAQATRVAELQDQREAAPAAPLSRMTLAVEGAQGGEDRITVDLRGTAVDAHIATDAISAERLRQRSVELQDALGRHGLDAELLRVSSNAPGGDAGTGGREPRTREEARREQQGPRDEPRARDQQDDSRRGRRNPYQERAG
jgi:hypothetical protein